MRPVANNYALQRLKMSQIERLGYKHHNSPQAHHDTRHGTWRNCKLHHDSFINRAVVLIYSE